MSQGDSETAFAKINLALHVRSRGADGYHRIETLFVFAEHGDRLTVSPADVLSLTVTGPFADMLSGEGDNLVLRAARAMQHAYGISAGAALHLDKQLPVASGIGGGSADAAAALRLLSRFWGVQRDGRIEQIAEALGADVPASVRSEPMRGEGRGDDLTPIEMDGLAGLPLLLVNPRVAVSTAAVFARWDGIDRGPLDIGAPIAAALSGRNDLEPAARAIAPEIATVLATLGACEGRLLTRMSGSGATCFALFENASTCTAADREIARLRSDWWRLKTALRGQPFVP